MKFHFLLRLVVYLFVFYSIYALFLFCLQRRILFPRYLIDTASMPPVVRSDVERIWIHTEFGRVEAWFLPAPRGNSSKPKGVVIFAHGNAELIDMWVEPLSPFTKMGMGLLLVEYPGYGRSTGHPTERSITASLIGAYDWLTHHKAVDASRIVLFGRSLGGGAVSRLAAERDSAALILMSTFVSVRSLAARYLLPGCLVRDAFDSLDVVRQYPHPVLVIHGKSDEIIPYSHAKTLYRAARCGKLLGYACGHNDCPADWDVFWQDLQAFLQDAGF